MFPVTGRGNPILAFALGMSNLLHQGMHLPLVYGTIFGILMVEGFVATTLDTAIRLNRYLFEELWQMLFKNSKTWWILKQYWFNSGLAVLLMLLFGLNNLFKELWPLFGTANQLLAAFTLIVAAAWMYLRHRKTWFLLAPAAFMTVTTVTSLVTLGSTYLDTGKLLLGTADIVLIVLTAGLVFFSVKLYLQLQHKQVVEQT
jgi:carbon starvation protein